MFLFRSIARRYLTPCAVPIAVGLFALADWMLYYSVEMKQYSGDVVLTLVALLLAAGPGDRSADWPAAMSRRWLLGSRRLRRAGCVVLVSAGARAGGGRDVFDRGSRVAEGLEQGAAFVAISVVWALSFAICYKVSHRILSKGRFIWDWWDFAFLPLPPHSIAELQTGALATGQRDP